MFSTLRILVTISVLSCTLFACEDHRQTPVATLRQRVKTIERVGSSTTTYTYDQNNRASSYTTTNGSKGLFYYDFQNRYARYDIVSLSGDQMNGRRYRFNFTSNSNALSVAGIDFTSTTETTNETRSYGLDNSHHITSFSNGLSNGYLANTYQYTGDNITSGVFIQGRNLENRTFDHDDKPNPYFGLIIPGIDEFLTYNRNNIIKITYNGTSIEYVYEYNVQGLPTRVARKDGLDETRFTYESF